MSLYRRHILSLVAIFFIVSGFFSWLNYGVMQGHIDDAKRERVELLAEVVTNGLKSMMIEGRPKEEFQRFLDGFAAEDIKAVRIFSDSGTILSSTVPGEVGRSVDANHVNAFKTRRGPSLFIHRSEGREVYSSIKVMGNDWPCQRCHGSGDEIRAIVDLEVLHGTEGRLLTSAAAWSIVIWLVTTGLLAFAVTLMTRSQISKPLDKVMDKISIMAAGDPAARTPVSLGDEIAAVSSGVSWMASELEKARQAVQQYESTKTSQLERMASIGEIAATVAHEIKNPLAGISGALQVMAEDMPHDSPRKEICSEILSEIDRLDQCVKELIIFARPQETNPVLADLNDIVARAAAAVKKMTATTGIEVTVVPAMLPEIVVDPELLEKVIRDVLFYQLQHIPDGSSITMSSEYDQEKNEVTIISADTGIALPDEKIRNIFKPSFSTKHAGTGLGLAISRNIIESLGGRIKVESAPGMGNFFYIIIPGKRQ